MEPEVRLSKLMSERGLCSRREADRYIERGWVSVNGEVVASLGTKVPSDATIVLSRQAQRSQEEKVTILLNKPVGYVSTQPEKGYRAAIELIKPKLRKHLQKLSVCGRLDIDSKGLLVFTQDGSLAKKLIGPDNRIEKEYVVRVEGKITDSAIEKLCHGLSLDGEKLKHADVSLVKEQLLRFVLRQGKKRQIRRMCELVGLRVVWLKRIRMGNVELGSLKEGQWRYLGEHENF